MHENKESLESAELERIKSETARNIAEKDKFEVERKELESINDRSWFRSRFFVEGAVGGIVVAGLLVAWLVEFFQPILKADQDISALENKKIKVQSEIQNFENKLRSLEILANNRDLDDKYKSLEYKNSLLVKEKEKLYEDTENLKRNYKQLYDEYLILADKSVEVDFDRKKFEGKAKDAAKEVDLLVSRLNDSDEYRPIAPKLNDKSELIGEWSIEYDLDSELSIFNIFKSHVFSTDLYMIKHELVMESFFGEIPSAIILNKDSVNFALLGSDKKSYNHIGILINRDRVEGHVMVGNQRMKFTMYR